MLPVLKAEREYKQLYWKNVWELEEADIGPEDIGMWRVELLTGGKYAASVANFLLSHRDRNYFRTVNTDLLFEMLNQLAINLAVFDSVTQQLFCKTKKDYQGRETGERAEVLSCDKLTEAFQEHKEDRAFIKRNADYLRLSIYMVEIDAYQIGAMWSDVYAEVPETAEGILEEYVMGENLPQLIYHNLEVIFDAIMGEGGQSEGTLKERREFEKSGGYGKLERLRAALNEKTQKHNYKALNSYLAAIWDE